MSRFFITQKYVKSLLATRLATSRVESVSRFFRRTPPPPPPPSSVRIPIQGTVGSAFVVYFAPRPGAPPSDEELAEAAARWSDAHLEPPLRDAVADVRNRGLMSIQLKPVDQLPPLPIELLRYMGLGELEERIVRSATHLVLLMGMDINRHPRVVMWAVLAAALGVRDLLEGALFDPEALRIIDPDQATRSFSVNGDIGVTHHIIVPFSIGEKGLGWMTTRGLGKFGLPDLELHDVPPNLNKLNVLMNAVGQHLVEATFRTVAEHNGKVEELELAPEFTVDRSTVARASARKPDDEAARDGAVNVAIRFDDDDRAPGPPMIRIQQPRSFEGDTGVWLNHVAEELLGSEHQVRFAKTGGNAMMQAHERAMSELPRVKQRFVAGLKPGEVLFIKHGFATTAGSLEYMWAAVNRWDGKTLTGQLANEPREVAGLRMGMTVVLEEADLFDWMIQLPGDRSEGGYTSDVALNEGLEPPSE